MSKCHEETLCGGHLQLMIPSLKYMNEGHNLDFFTLLHNTSIAVNYHWVKIKSAHTRSVQPFIFGFLLGEVVQIYNTPHG